MGKPFVAAHVSIFCFLSQIYTSGTLDGCSHRNKEGGQRVALGFINVFLVSKIRLRPSPHTHPPPPPPPPPPTTHQNITTTHKKKRREKRITAKERKGEENTSICVFCCFFSRTYPSLWTLREIFFKKKRETGWTKRKVEEETSTFFPSVPLSVDLKILFFAFPFRLPELNFCQLFAVLLAALSFS